MIYARAPFAPGDGLSHLCCNSCRFEAEAADAVDGDCPIGVKLPAPNSNVAEYCLSSQVSLLMINSLFVAVVAVLDYGRWPGGRSTVLFVVAGQDRSHERMTHCASEFGANGKSFESGMASNLKSDFARRIGTKNPHQVEGLEVYRFRLNYYYNYRKWKRGFRYRRQL